MTKFYFDRMYNGQVDVTYIDLSEPENQEAHQEILQQVRELHIPFPLVAVDGEMRLAGGAEFYRIKPLVDEALQNRAA